MGSVLAGETDVLRDVLGAMVVPLPAVVVCEVEEGAGW